MLIKLGILFLLVGILVGSTQYADAFISVSTIVDSWNVEFNKLYGALYIDFITINGTSYALVLSSSDDGIQIIDITDPYLLLDVFSFDSDNVDRIGNAFDLGGLSDLVIVTVGEIPYVLTVSSIAGLQIIDISDPSSLLVVASIRDHDLDKNDNVFEVLDGPNSIDIVTVGEIPYAIVTAKYADNGIQIIDISDPSSPLAVASIKDKDLDKNGDIFGTLSNITDLDIVTIDEIPYALVTSRGDNGIQIIDISDPYSPLATSSINNGDEDINNNTFDILSDPVFITTMTIGPNTFALTVNSNDGIQIIDISNPASPLAVAGIRDNDLDKNDNTFDTLSDPFAVTTITIDEIPYALVTSRGDDGIQIIDISNPASPLAVDSIRVNDVDEIGNTFDAITNPNFITTMTIGETPYALVTFSGIGGNYIDDGLQIIDISSLSDGAGYGSFFMPDDYALEEEDSTLIYHYGDDPLNLILDDLITNSIGIILPKVDITTNDVNISFTDDTIVSGMADDYMLIQTSTRDPGFADNVSVVKLVELGIPDVDITFDKPVRLSFHNQAGNDPFYINAANETHLITTECTSDEYDDVYDQLSVEPLDLPYECFIDVGDDLVIWTTHFTAYGTSTTDGYTTDGYTTDGYTTDGFSTTDDSVDDTSGGGSANKHLTRPTFGLSHDTQNQLVDDAFTFNNNTFNITDNWHTPFGIQNVTLGESNSFSAKVYAQNDLKIQEFVFGIPNVGDVHKAELGIEVWYDFTGGITETKVIQKTNVIDVSTLNATGSKVKCQESDTSDNCFMTNISMVFLEPLYDDVMAIKAIDFENRYQTTYLNDGFDISGDSLNPMLVDTIAGTKKYEGPILVTQTAKYSNIWIAQDGREFERNDSGSFKHINPSHVRHADPGEPKTRLHSQFFTLQQVEEIKAKYVLAEICRRCQDISYDKIDNIIELMPSPTHRNSDSELQQMIIYEAIKAEYTLDKMLDIYSSNPFYKEFRK